MSSTSSGAFSVIVKLRLIFGNFEALLCIVFTLQHVARMVTLHLKQILWIPPVMGHASSYWGCHNTQCGWCMAAAASRRSHPSPDSAGPVCSALCQQPQTSNSHSAHILQHCTDIFAIMQFKCTLVIRTSNSNSVDIWWSRNSIPISRTRLKPTISVIYTSTHPHCPFSTSIKRSSVSAVVASPRPRLCSQFNFQFPISTSS